MRGFLRPKSVISGNNVKNVMIQELLVKLDKFRTYNTHHDTKATTLPPQLLERAEPTTLHQLENKCCQSLHCIDLEKQLLLAPKSKFLPKRPPPCERSGFVICESCLKYKESAYAFSQSSSSSSPQPPIFR